MLSKPKIKFINSLKTKKYRDKHNLFVAEGEKLINDLSKSFRCKYLICPSECKVANSIVAEEYFEVDSADDMKKVSSLSTPNGFLAVFYQKKATEITIERLNNSLTLVLEDIQDSGNFGTIIRLADWFGIKDIVCSPKTVDMFNAKVVQSTMGALANVTITYTDIEAFLSKAQRHNVNIYGTFLDGENIYNYPLQKSGVVVMGNEGSGISDTVERFVNHRITIPNFSTETYTSESLNVAIATSIVCSEFRRRL